jgi:hypothetical protein
LSWISEARDGVAVTLVAGLVDDAGLFPPESLSMAAAVARHRGDLRCRNPVLTHRFVCPLARFDELEPLLDEARPIDVVVLAPLTEEAIVEVVERAGPEVRVVGLDSVLPEAPPSVLQGAVELLADRVPGAELYLEVGLGAGLEHRLDAAAAAGRAVKVRCGGISAEFFPQPKHLAQFLVSAAARVIPFKATAGLHHAVSYQDPATGFPHYGFLNVLVALADAQRGAYPDDVEAVLRARAPGPLLARARAMDHAEAARVRSQFRSFGCCSTAEPVDDLVQLGLLDHQPSI